MRKLKLLPKIRFKNIGWRRYVYAATSLTVAALALVSYQFLVSTAEPPERSEPNKGKPPGIFVEKAERAQINPVVETAGEVKAHSQIELVAETAGRVLAISANFEPGGSFAAGEPLVLIDPADYQLDVSAAKAGVARAEQEYITELALAEVAREQREAEGDLDPSPLAVREPQLKKAELAKKNAQDQLQKAELQLARTEVKAPFSGRVIERIVGMGKYVNKGAVLGRIFASTRAQIKVPLTDNDLWVLGLYPDWRAPQGGGLAVSLRATLAGYERSWEGVLVAVDAHIDGQARTVFGTVEVVDPYREQDRSAAVYGAERTVPLPVGLFVKAAIRANETRPAVAIPVEALHAANRVFVVDPHQQNCRAAGKADV